MEKLRHSELAVQGRVFRLEIKECALWKLAAVDLCPHPLTVYSITNNLSCGKYVDMENVESKKTLFQI